MNDFDQTEGYWRPIVEDLLFSYDRGAIAQVGPTRGSYASGNILFGREFLKRLYEPGTTVGRAFLLAQRNAILENPTYRQPFESYVLLGDPRIGPSVVTGVDGGSAGVLTTRLMRPEPNPFNPVTRLRYYLSKQGRVSLRIFDVRGRLVRDLVPNVQRPSGHSSVLWDGRTQTGREAASGVYFAIFRANGVNASERLVLLR